MGGGSWADDTTPKYCGDTLAADQTNFPGYVDFVLQALVSYTHNRDADPTTGETKFDATNPVDGGIGAATGYAICYSGVIGDSCTKCLRGGWPYVSSCRKFTSASIYFDQRCFLQFSQL
ncbi:unnamed protein product [Linum trigynum]